MSVTQTGIPAADAHGNDDMVRVVEEVLQSRKLLAPQFRPFEGLPDLAPIQGWKRNLLDRIKMVFGFGVPEFH